MCRLIRHTINLMRTLVILVAMACLITMSNQHGLMEECLQEVVQQESELSLVRRTEQESTCKAGQLPNDYQDCRLKQSVGNRSRLFLLSTERDGINGSGSYLLI